MRTTGTSGMYPGASLMDEAEVDAVTRVAESRSLFRYYGITEPTEVRAYEEEWSAHLGLPHALAVNSGTSALYCALAAVGVGPGDEVVLPAFAWASVPNAVLSLGALPVVVDVDDSLTLDPAAVAAHLTERTRAIVPVHMRGGACALRELLALADDAGVAVVEDACQAVGVRYDGRPAGTFGDVAAFSTQYAKLVSTGEGGVVATADDAIHRAALDAHDPAAALRRGEELSEIPGLNFRCTELQAAVGRIQLRRVPELVARMRSVADPIARAVDEAEGLTLRAVTPGSEPNGATVILFTESAGHAAALAAEIARADMPSSVLYRSDVPDLHVAPWWRPVDAAYRATERARPAVEATLHRLERAVQIDIHPLHTADDVERTCEALASFVAA